MSRFEQVSQLVDQDVFEALWWLLRQIRVQADVAGDGIATTPFGLHSLDKNLVRRYSDDRLPFAQEARESLPQLPAIPVF